MIPHEFEYASPATLQEALQLIADGSGKILAGGMSLIPMMKLRLAAPGNVVDLGRVPGLKQISESQGVVHIGAMATHHEVETSTVARSRCPLLAEAAGSIGDTQARNLVTIGLRDAAPDSAHVAPLRVAG